MLISNSPTSNICQPRQTQNNNKMMSSMTFLTTQCSFWEWKSHVSGELDLWEEFLGHGFAFDNSEEVIKIDHLQDPEPLFWNTSSVLKLLQWLGWHNSCIFNLSWESDYISMYCLNLLLPFSSENIFISYQGTQNYFAWNNSTKQQKQTLASPSTLKH